MLPKKHRLSLRKEFVRLQKEGRVFPFSGFGLLLGKNNLEISRFGFIVSNKIHKRATKRNRIKRLLREATRFFLPKVKPGFDCVFLVKKNILNKDFGAVKNAVEKAFKETGILEQSISGP